MITTGYRESWPRDRNGMPLIESYAFGVNYCALCNEPGELERHRLVNPVWADQGESEVLIPSGAQMFHPVCFAGIREAS